MCSSIEQTGQKSKSLSVIIRVNFGACCLAFRFDSFRFGKVTRENECSIPRFLLVCFAATAKG